VHRLMCGPCRVYRRQLELLRCHAAKLAASSPDIRLDGDARDRIRAQLRGAVDNKRGAD